MYRLLLRLHRTLPITLAILGFAFMLPSTVGAQIYLTQWGSYGSGNGQFAYPTAVATDAAGNVYVADQFNHRIQKFTGTGTYLTQWGSYGSGNGQFNQPGGVATDAAANVYVADPGNYRIQKFGPAPTFTKTCFSGNLAPATAVGDFNHDGKLDVAICPGSQEIPYFIVPALVDVYLGNGDGTFGGPMQLNAADFNLNMVAADLNNDGTSIS